MIYLDWAATAIPDETILRGCTETAIEVFANPSSHHSAGRNAREYIENARKTWAKVLGTSSENIYFTSGGTESNNLVFQHLFLKKKPAPIIISGIEHASVYEPAMRYRSIGGKVAIAGAERSGHISLETLEKLLEPDTAFVSVMAVSNETGARQDLRGVVALIRGHEKRHGKPIHIHTDAVQAFGKVPFSLETLDVDSVSFSGHKIGGPRGAGVLYLKKPIPTITAGGEQEQGLRPGTENLCALYGSALAAEKAYSHLKDNFSRASALAERLIRGCSRFGGIELFRTEGNELFSPYILNVFIPPVPGEVIQRLCNDKGIAIGTGSACSSSAVKRKRAGKFMGLPEKLLTSSIRLSIGYTTTEEEIDLFLNVLKNDILPLAKTLSS